MHVSCAVCTSSSSSSVARIFEIDDGRRLSLDFLAFLCFPHVVLVIVFIPEHFLLSFSSIGIVAFALRLLFFPFLSRGTLPHAFLCPTLHRALFGA